jgi:hypothetical protein
MALVHWMARLPWERRHPRLFSGVRFAAGGSLLVVAGILWGYQTGGWLPVGLVAVAALAFYVAHRLPGVITATRASRDAR